MGEEEDTRRLVKDVIVKIPKKVSLKNCDNWRGITLLSITSKILGKVIIQKFQMQ